MNTAKRLSGLALATAAAGLFAAATIPMSASAGENVQCVGVNGCKGLSSCKTANSSCKGLNECKGQGFVEVTKDVCKQLGGEMG